MMRSGNFMGEFMVERRFLPDQLPSHPNVVNADEPAPETPGFDRSMRITKRVLGYGGAGLILAALGFGLYGAIHGMQAEKDDHDDEAARKPGPSVSASLSPSPSASPSTEASPSASASSSPSASESASASASSSASASASPSAIASASQSAVAPPVESSPPTPTEIEPCAEPANGALTLCDTNVAPENFVGYRTLRDTVPIWNPLVRNAQVVPECQVPGYVLVDDTSRPEGSQAAYVPVQAIQGDLYNVASCPN